MAEEILVKEPLTSEMIAFGEAVWKALDSAKFPVDALFWLYTSEANAWRLVVVSPLVNEAGPLKGYARLRKALSKVHIEWGGLDQFSITLMRTDDVLVQALATLNKENRLSRQRLSRGYFYWVFVEDIYVYFVSDSLQAFEGAEGFAHVPLSKGESRPRVKWRKMRSMDDRSDNNQVSNGS
jgi:hypothetical protein